MWEKIITSRKNDRFFLLVMHHPWIRKSKSTSRKKIERYCSSVILYVLHYGLKNTLRKILEHILTIFGCNSSRANRKYAQMCLRHGIEFSTVKPFCRDELFALIKRHAPDIILHQAPIRLDEELLYLPARGIISRHPSLLPQYKGCFPVFWAFLRKEKEFGVTIHRVEKKYDSGQILAQMAFKAGEKESLADVYRRTYEAGADLFIKTLDTLSKTTIVMPVMPKYESSYFGWPSLPTLIKFVLSARYCKRNA